MRLTRACSVLASSAAPARDGDARAGRLQFGLGIATFPTPRSAGRGSHVQRPGHATVVAWNTKDALRQLVLVVNTYPLSAELEEAVRRVQDAASCLGA